MAIAKVTYKGQVTIPKGIRQELGIQDGDSLLFQVDDGKVTLRRVKRANLLDLYGAFPATRPFPGEEAIRAEVRRHVAKHVARIPE